MDETPKDERPQYRKSSPSVLQSYPSLKRGRQELKVRLLQYPQSEPLLDIREYVVSDQYNGFTKKGLALTYDQILQLEEIFKVVKVHMEEMP